MAEIKDFNRHQYLLNEGNNKNDLPVEENENDSKSMKKKLARHRQLRFYTVFSIVAVIAVILFVIYINWKNKIYTTYEVIQQTDYVHSNDTECFELAGNILNYSNDGMNCMDTRGRIIWNQTYEIQNPIIRSSGKIVAVADYNGRTIYVANTEEILGQINTTMPIRDFCVSANGIVAVVLDNSTVTSIYLYSCKKKDPLVGFKTTMSKSGYPIALNISDDGTILAVSYLKADGGKLTTNIGFYNFSSVGQNYTDNLVSAYGYSEAVVPMLGFMNNDVSFALADNRLMFYQGRQKPENISDILISENILSVFNNKNYIGLVYYNSGAETTYRMEIYNTSAQKVTDLYFDMEYNDIVFGNSSIIIYNSDECIIYDWNSNLKYDGSFQNKVKCLIPTSNIERYHVVVEDYIQLIQLK